MRRKCQPIWAMASLHNILHYQSEELVDVWCCYFGQIKCVYPQLYCCVHILSAHCVVIVRLILCPFGVLHQGCKSIQADDTQFCLPCCHGLPQQRGSEWIVLCFKHNERMSAKQSISEWMLPSLIDSLMFHTRQCTHFTFLNEWIVDSCMVWWG